MTQSTRADLDFVHRFVPAETPGRTPLLLLHGTGGDENDLIPLGLQLSPGAALLSPRGKENENGAPRFFRRRSEGVFDVEDLNARTEELAGFVNRARETYRLEKPIAVGFSNGANIAWSLLLNRPETLSGAILMRAMLPFQPQQVPALTGKRVLLLSGAADPLVGLEQRDTLAQLLRAAGAAVQYEVLPAGHNLTRLDIELAQDWLTEGAP